MAEVGVHENGGTLGNGRHTKAVARLFRLAAPALRAIVFTGATRNSLVVLPPALALPDDLAVAAVVLAHQVRADVDAARRSRGGQYVAVVCRGTPAVDGDGSAAGVNSPERIPAARPW